MEGYTRTEGVGETGVDERLEQAGPEVGRLQYQHALRLLATEPGTPEHQTERHVYMLSVWASAERLSKDVVDRPETWSRLFDDGLREASQDSPGLPEPIIKHPGPSQKDWLDELRIICARLRLSPECPEITSYEQLVSGIDSGLIRIIRPQEYFRLICQNVDRPERRRLVQMRRVPDRGSA